MKCPKCEQELVRGEAEGLELDVCPGCRGIWFDEGELRQAKDLANENLNWMDFALWKDEDAFQIRPGTACPRCEGPMGSLEYADTGVQIEACPTCRGVWLDAKDLEQIVRALEDELVGKPAKELFADTLREAAELVTGPERFLSEWRDLRQVLRLLQMRLTIDKPGFHERIASVLRGTPFGT